MFSLDTFYFKHCIMKTIIVTTFLVVNFLAFSQQPKAKLSDSISGWFRFEKGRHALNFHTGINILEARNDDFEKEATIYAPGILLGYSYVPLNRLVVQANIFYAYHFNMPHYDSQTLYYTIGTEYILFGKNRFFLAPGVNLFVNNYYYKIHPDYPNHKFFNDSIIDAPNSRNVFSIQPKIDYGMMIGNNMSIRIGVGYNLILNRPSGNLPITPIMFNLNATYHFPMKKYRNLNK